MRPVCYGVWRTREYWTVIKHGRFAWTLALRRMTAPIEMLEPAEASRLLSELINRLLHIDSNTIHICLIRFYNYIYHSELCRTLPVALSLCVHYVPVYNIRYFIRDSRIGFAQTPRQATA